MKQVTTPDKKDIVRSVIFLSIYVITIGVTAFLLLPKYWYLWTIVVLAGMLFLVNWHQKKTAYRCPNCDHIYEISFLTDLIAPHGLDRNGSWLLLRCPNCQQRRKTTVLKKINPD
jgi:DNA-directed RNA polymerase subunit RPC12/RpoP